MSEKVTTSNVSSLCVRCLMNSCAQFLDFLRTREWYVDQLSSPHTLPARQSTTFSISSAISCRVCEAVLAKLGISELFSHQAEALRILLRRDKGKQHVVVTTATASGKSLIYNIAGAFCLKLHLLQ